MNLWKLFRNKRLRIAMSAVLVLVLGIVAVKADERADLENFYKRWKKQSTHVLKHQGVESLKQGNVEQALTFFNMMMERYDEDASREEQHDYVFAYVNAGGVLYSMYSDYQQAYNYFMNALEISRRFGFEESYPYIYANIGSIYSDLEDNEQAMNYYLKAFDHGLKLKDWYAASLVASNIFTQALESGELPHYYHLLDKLARVNIPRDDANGRYLLVYTDALSQLRAGNTDKALAGFDELMQLTGLNIYEKPAQLLVVSHQSKAYIYSMAKKWTSAIDECAKSEKIINDSSINRSMLKDIYISMSQFSRMAGKKDLAYDYLHKAYNTGSSQDMESRQTHVNAMQSLFELNRKNTQIARMTREGNFRNVVLFAALLVVLVSVSILIIVVRNSRRLKAKNLQIYSKNMELLDWKKQETNRIIDYEKRMAAYELQLSQQSLAAAEVPEKVLETTESENRLAEVASYRTSSLSDARKLTILEQINKVMEANAEIYHPDFSIAKLADLVASPTKYVSQVINESYNKNFSTFLGEYRIREACRRLLDPSYGRYTIDALAAEVGFKSRSAFFTVFKKITGITPSEYMKIAKKGTH